MMFCYVEVSGMLRDKLMDAMNELHLHGMRSVLDEILSAGIKQRHTPERLLLDLLEAELAERTARSIRYRLGIAKFPVDTKSHREEPNRPGYVRRAGGIPTHAVP